MQNCFNNIILRANKLYNLNSENHNILSSLKEKPYIKNSLNRIVFCILEIVHSICVLQKNKTLNKTFQTTTLLEYCTYACEHFRGVQRSTCDSSYDIRMMNLYFSPFMMLPLLATCSKYFINLMIRCKYI